MPGTALITGASSGLGAEFTRQLAARGYALVLVARRVERLASLAADLQDRYGVSIEIFPADLSDPAEVGRVVERVTALQELEFLINNAGFGLRGRFASGELQKHLDMIQLHILASVRLCHAALPTMIALGKGYVINVASMAAFFPIRNATYSATKVFLVNFSEALQSELSGSGVHVQVLCPGYFMSEFHQTPEYRGYNHSQIPWPFWLSASDVVAYSLKCLGRRRVICIPGFQYQVAAILLRNALTASLIRVVVSWLYRNRR